MITQADIETRQAAITARYDQKRRELFREQDTLRNIAWLDNPRITLVGKRVRHLTIHDYLSLQLSGNAFLTGGVVYPVDVFDFLWQVRADSRTGWFPRLKQYWHDRRIRYSITAAKEEIETFLDDSLQDLPNTPRKNGPQRRPVAAATIVSLIHLVAEAYGLDPDEVKHKPMCRVLQLSQRIASSGDKEFLHVSPAEVKLNVEELQEIQTLLDEAQKEGGE
jgi:hypothetical protein